MTEIKKIEDEKTILIKNIKSQAEANKKFITDVKEEALANGLTFG